MKYHQVPFGEVHPSVLCLGTATFGSDLDRSTAFQLLDTFFEYGGNFIDTAHVYGAWIPDGLGLSETIIGQWVKGGSEQITWYLKRKSKVRFMPELEEQFEHPSADYRTAPLWGWNDNMSEEGIEAHLLALKKHGFGGAFVHPRPGLITEYLSDEWFARWSYALETAVRLGMKLYIYDENSYPSDFAGGHVPAQLPDCLATSATYRIEHLSQRADNGDSGPQWAINTSLLKVFACSFKDDKRDQLRIEHDLTTIPEEQWHEYSEWIMLIETVSPQTMPWLGGFAYVDLMRPEVTQVVLETTYEAYYRLFGRDFGTHIPAIFTDEPAIAGSDIYHVEKKHLPFSYWFAAEFAKRRDYHLLDHLPALFKNVECAWFVKDAVKVRYDYYCTIRELWVENFLVPIATWCEKHGVAWTGHFLENFWPLVGGMMVSPAIMSLYEYFQWPALDLLLTSPLRETATDPLLVTLLEIQSVANQLSKQRVLCEAYGAGGWDAGLADFKRMGDWLLVHGVNVLTQHYSLSTTAGARKRDHPQSFDWREPWWDDYTALNEYAARASFLLSQGKAHQRLLVLHPTTTGFLVPKEEEDSDIMWGHPPMQPDMRAYLELLQRLTDEQWDFDLGDEFLLERHASVDGKRLRVGLQAYDVVLVSAEMQNMRGSTLHFLCEFLAAGGQVLSQGMPGPYLDGETHPQIFAELARYAGYHLVSRDDVEQRLTPRIHSGVSWPAGLAHLRKELDEQRTVYFFVNHTLSSFDAQLELEGTHVEKWDLWSGERTIVPTQLAEHGLMLHLHLNHNESCLLIAHMCS